MIEIILLFIWGWQSLDLNSGCPATEDSVHIVCHYPALVCRKYRTLGRMFVMAKDLENMRVNSLTSLVANIRLIIVP